MPVTTAKMTDIAAARIGAARQLVGTRIVPVAAPAGRKAAAQTRQLVGERIMPAVGPACSKAAKRTRQLLDQRITPVFGPFGRRAAKQTRQLIGERIMPAVGTALVVSAPIRGEALRRAGLAATALRTGEAIVVKKRRRWPVALMCLGLGGVLGATAAWLAQAGKPVQLTPYPLETDDMDDTELRAMNGSHPLDDSPAHHHA
ncbi:MAG TPA: hypothetical protein VFG00_16350 [Acidothermaceae bacterium]|nr:hypothetical protein [Acidothermaceae bacterium]